MASLAEWLSGLDSTELAKILELRPDSVRGIEPRWPAELADRLSGPESVASSLRLAPAPVLELLEALLTLGRPTRGALRELLEASQADTPREHLEQVDAALAWLRERAIVYPGDGDDLAYPPGLHELIPNPLGLGRPARHLLDDVNAATVNKMLTRWGHPRQTSKRAAADAMASVLNDAARVRQVVSAGPAGAAEELLRRASSESDDDLYADVRPGQLAVWSRRAQATSWAAEHGLLVQSYWGSTEMPAEVARALRGPGFKAPFHPKPPAGRAFAVDPAAVERESQVALTAFADRFVAVLDRLARTPVKGLASGGIGVRELGRLEKTTGYSEAQLRLALELAVETGLLSLGARVEVSGTFARWRAQSPAERAPGLLMAWWYAQSTPTQVRGEDGKARPVTSRAPCPSCRQAREALLKAAERLGPATASDPADLLRALLWASPLAHVVAVDGEPERAAVWLEAEQLGVVAHGALSELGRALLAEDTEELHRVVTAALPAATQHVTYGSDLTAVATGQPSARVSAVLDGAADREGHGPATMWRFSVASVRRALDEGADVRGLLADLESVASNGFPQPLRYLLEDVGRRHGALRVRAAVSVVVSDDPVLIAQLAADRSLRSLGLRVVAPTVLLSGQDDAATVGALRKAGYLPVREDSAGVRLADGVEPSAESGTSRAEIVAWVANNGFEVPNTRLVPRRGLPPAPPAVDWGAVAARILAADGSGTDVATSTELAVAGYARNLGAAHIRLLAQAIDTRGAVRIEYVAASGGHTVRTISDIEHIGSQLSAWCHLRVDERQFALDRIRSVAPA